MWLLFNTFVVAYELPRPMARTTAPNRERVYGVFKSWLGWLSAVVLLVGAATAAFALWWLVPAQAWYPSLIGGVLLPLMLMFELKADVYDQQLRKMGSFGRLWVAAMCVLYAGCCLTAIGIAANTALAAASFGETWHGYWGVAFVIVAVLAICWMSVVVGRFECLRKDDYGHVGYRTDREPWHGVVQNVPQHAALVVLFLVPAVTFCLGVNRLLMATSAGPSPQVVIALLYGFFTLAAVVIVFPLNNNMEYAREVDARRMDFASLSGLDGSHDSCATESGDRAARALVGHITLVCLSIGAIAVLIAGWVLVSLTAWVFQ